MSLKLRKICAIFREYTQDQQYVISYITYIITFKEVNILEYF